MIIDDQMRFGAGVIYEEETDLEDFVTNTTRLSAYFHDNFAVAENVNFNTTIYYQPESLILVTLRQVSLWLLTFR